MRKTLRNLGERFALDGIEVFRIASAISSYFCVELTPLLRVPESIDAGEGISKLGDVLADIGADGDVIVFSFVMDEGGVLVEVH